MTVFGYARVSTGHQHTDQQETRLLAAGVEREHLFVDHGVSGTRASRPEWDRLLGQLRRGDVVKFTKLDRIGRSTQHLLDVVRLLGERGVDLVALDQAIDTVSPAWKLLFTIMAAIAEFQADLIRSNTVDGLAAARARRGVDKLPGRKPSWTADQQATARALFDARGTNGMTAERVAAVVGVSVSTLYRMMRTSERTAT